MNAPIYTPGRIVWRELFTPDIEASRAFYESLCGWSIEKERSGKSDYHLIKADARPVGGLVPLPAFPRRGVPARWVSYVSVPDVDEAVAATRTAGGKILQDPMDTPPMGRLAVIEDPQGGIIAVWRGTKGDPPADDRPAVGSFFWEHLSTTDPAAARRFYRRVLGWDSAPFKGAEGISLFIPGQPPEAAGYMLAPPGVSPDWLSYVVVESLEETRGRAARSGGRVLSRSIPIPSLGRFDVIRDPHRAQIALFEPTPSFG